MARSISPNAKPSMAEYYGAQRTGSTGGSMRAAVASAAVHGELNDAPAGGPGSSSTPGSRCQNAQPVVGAAWMLSLPERTHRAEVPWYTSAMKWVQCQQGWLRSPPGVEYMLAAFRAENLFWQVYELRGVE